MLGEGAGVFEGERAGYGDIDGSGDGAGEGVGGVA